MDFLLASDCWRCHIDAVDFGLLIELPSILFSLAACLSEPYKHHLCNINPLKPLGNRCSLVSLSPLLRKAFDKRKLSMFFIMAFNVQYEGRSVELLEFLSLDIPDDVKQRVWEKNDVSDRLFINHPSINSQFVKKPNSFFGSQTKIKVQLDSAVLKMLENSNLCIVLKRLISDEKYTKKNLTFVELDLKNVVKKKVRKIEKSKLISGLTQK